MKFSLIFLGLFVVATAAPLAIRRAEHVPAGVVDGRDVQNGDMVRRSDNSSVRVVHANDDGIKRNLEENLETRQWAKAAGIIGDVAGLIGDIIEAIKYDNTLRDDFTQKSVTDLAQKWPNFNWVICHTDHTIAFDGAEGTDWGHSHHELDLVFGTMGYELYWLRSGTFIRKGDGGYLNWAYQGDVTGTEKDGSVVHFAQPA